MRGDADLFDRPLVGAENLDVVVVEVDAPAFGRDCAGFMENVAADGVILGALGDFDAEVFFDVDDAHFGVDDPAAGGQGAEKQLLIDVVFVGDLSHEFFEDVFNGDDSFGAAVFVDDDGEVDLLAAKLLEEMGDLFCLRRVEDRFDEAFDGGLRRVFVQRVLEDVFVEEDADDVVDGIAIDRDAAVALFEKVVDGFVDGGIGREAEDVDAGNHHFARHPVFEGGDREDQFLLVVVEGEFRLLEDLENFIADLDGAVRGFFFGDGPLEGVEEDGGKGREEGEDGRRKRGCEAEEELGFCSRDQLNAIFDEEPEADGERAHRCRVCDIDMAGLKVEGVGQRGLEEEEENGADGVADDEDEFGDVDGEEEAFPLAGAKEGLEGAVKKEERGDGGKLFFGVELSKALEGGVDS